MKRKKCVLKEEEILALLRLQKTSSIGDILAKKLIATVGSAADIFTENKKEGIKILKRLGFNKKIIEAFIGNIYLLEDEEDQLMKEIIMCKVPKRLLN